MNRRKEGSRKRRIKKESRKATKGEWEKGIKRK